MISLICTKGQIERSSSRGFQEVKVRYRDDASFTLIISKDLEGLEIHGIWEKGRYIYAVGSHVDFAFPQWDYAYILKDSELSLVMKVPKNSVFRDEALYVKKIEFRQNLDPMEDMTKIRDYAEKGILAGLELRGKP